MQALSKELRRKLENTIRDARDVAEEGARAILDRLAVGAKEPHSSMSPDERQLRVALRARSRALGDRLDPNSGKQDTLHLVWEIGYEHWHRMLFARFLAENKLLIHDEMGVPVSLEDCEELAQEQGEPNGWVLAERYAARMLPQIFKPDDPVLQLKLSPEHQQALEKLLHTLPVDVFTADDSLGWTYQFWQARRKEEVNKSEVKIGADELPAVTQLFTEDYMVQFLLDNTLGAWWAGKKLFDRIGKEERTEAEWRTEVAMPGCEWSYLRFKPDGTPAAGTFDGWPDRPKELKVLDPCCGSGHFLVAAFDKLVCLRMADEGMDVKEAADWVLATNLFGLELDPRCTQIAAFALALAAWKRVGGYWELPELNVACSGIAITAKEEEWVGLIDAKDRNKRLGMKKLYEAFQQAPVLGSLIDPMGHKRDPIDELLFKDLLPYLEKALQGERGDEEKRQVGVAARGIARAARYLSQSYDLIATNVPYLTSGKQCLDLKKFCQQFYNEAKQDIATVFLDRFHTLCSESGTVAAVTPQNWLFLGAYSKFRHRLLNTLRLSSVGKLGPGAFETISGEVVNVALITMSKPTKKAAGDNYFLGLDASEKRSFDDKSFCIQNEEYKILSQHEQLKNPDARIVLDEKESKGQLLIKYVDSYEGIGTGDLARFQLFWWESILTAHELVTFRTTADRTTEYSGCTGALLWENGKGEMVSKAKEQNSRPTRGFRAWSKQGVAINRMRDLNASLFLGEKFDCNIAALIPKDISTLPAVWCFCATSKYSKMVREIDQGLKVTNHTLAKVPFDLDHWTKVAKEQYPHGLPKPYSDDPTQWIFHGHPCGSVIWDETAKWTAIGPKRTDAAVLQTAVAWLLGYRWPAETDPEMELSDESRYLVQEAQKLNDLADDDGVVCLPAVQGELPAHERLRELLARSYGDAWSPAVEKQLLEAVGYSKKTLEDWLKDGFFEQHCKLFHHRPFIWHIWDGKKDGFAALVLYHKLDQKLLSRLIYTHLGEWINRQKAELERGEGGAEARLLAAQNLQQRLLAILKGESPLDIFVRWKPLDQQPIGWHPDLNDGVRLNIRPFMMVEDVGKKGAGVLRAKPNINWNKDRGKDPSSAPWYNLGPQYGGKKGDRINDHHLGLEEKITAQKQKGGL